ncbi:MAG TPA: rod-binding protein, partial [Burkholderiaceae bacterium]|nr:rod-binding protein [Burkholderiaceae bacterium]
MSSADSLRLAGAMGREASAALAADGRSLDALRREAQRDPHAAVKKAATQFEALFMQMVLKSMREATLKSGLMDGGSGEAMMSSMFDQQLATTMAGQGGTLAQVLTAQLTRHLSPSAEGAEADRSGAIAAPQAATGLLRYLETAQLAPTPVANGEHASSEAFVRRHWQDALEAERVSGVPAGF